MAKQSETLYILTRLGNIFPNYPLADAAVQAYVALLADIPNETLIQAAGLHVSRSKFFPTIAELRQSAFEMQDADHPIPNPYEAWAEIVSEIARVHADGIPEFSHPLTGQVMRMFGWRNLCMSEEGSLDRAHFLKAYEAAADKLRATAQKPPSPEAYQAALQAGAPARQDALPSTGGEEDED